jgi:C4-dicarboxylate-specific signal transduction histidine kinase
MKKGIFLSLTALSLCVFQQIAGTGLFLDSLPVSPADRMIAIGFVGVFTISVLTVVRWRLYHAQKELQEQEKEIAESMNKITMGEMAANIAHEINNPLQSLSLQMFVMKDKYEHSDMHDHFHKMDHMIQRMAFMVQGLRDLSRKEAESTMEEFLFSDTLDEVLTLSSDNIMASGIQLSINGDSQLKTKGHSVQISQILINLLNNSIHAVRDLEEKWIKIDVRSKSSFLQISVTDSGRGISQTISQKIMEPFFTTKGLGQGTGLGLSISRSIAEKNHGKLYYDSASERTRFVLLLPLVN